MSELKIIESGNLLDMNKAASILGIKKSTLYAMVMRKQIAHKKLGKLTRFSVADIQAFVTKNHVEVRKVD